MTTPKDTILLIEQTPNSAVVCHRLLGQGAAAPFQLVTASYNEPILDLCRSRAVKAIILESCFADSRCLDLFSQLQAQLGKNCPAILVIDDDDLSLARQAFKAGAADYLAADQLTVDQLTQALQAAILLPSASSLNTHDRKPAEAALRELEAKYRTLFDAIDEGFCIFELIYNSDGRAVDWRCLDANPAFGRHTGWASPVGKRVGELQPDLEATWFEQFEQLVSTGKSIRFIDYSAAMDKWFEIYAFPVGEPNAGKITLLFEDITQRKQTEDRANQAAQRDSFRVALADALRSIDDPVAVQATACRLLGETLAASRVYYFEYDTSAGSGVVNHDYRSDGTPSIVGTYRFEDFPTVLTLLATGQPLVVADIAASTQISEREKDAFKQLGLVSLAVVPLVKNQRFVAAFNVAQSGYRQWTPLEIALVQETAERTWAAVERARAETALRQSEEKYRTLFNSIDEGYVLVEVLTDEQGQVADLLYIDANPAAVRMTGTELVGKQTRQLNADYEDYWFETAERVAKTGVGERHEFYSTPLKAWYDSYIFKVGESQAQRVAFIYKDVTQRKQAEENLQRSVKFNAFRVALTDALRSLVDPIAVQATATYILGKYCSAHRVAYFEVQDGHYVVRRDYTSGVASMVGRYPIESFGPDLLATYRAGQTAIAADTAADSHLSPDQHRAFAAVQIAAYIGVPLVKRGELVAGLAVHMATARDWTPDEIALAEEVAERTWATVERARAEAAVAADLADMRLLRDLSTRLVSENSIQVLYDETMAAAIALMRADGGTLQVLDEATQELVLLTTRGFSQTMIDYFYRISARSKTSCGVALCQGDRRFVDFDVPESEDPYGTLRMHKEAGYLSSQSTPLISRSGHLIGMVSTFWRTQHRPNLRELRFLDLLARQAADLIEQWRANEERNRLFAREQNARAEAERANRVKDEFLAILSHELRSPLNPILGWTKLLQSKRLDEAKTSQALLTIERNTKLQTQLIDDLLDIAKILRGKLEIADTPVSLMAVINAAVEVVRISAEAKAIAIELDLSTDCLVRGDDARLQQMIWNLLANAVKFTSAGGRVEVCLAAAGDQAQITIADTGKGISAAFLPRLFDAFHQEDTSITRQYGGLGLGLSIVKYLAEAHGGTISAASPGEGQGATFTLALPLINDRLHCLLDAARSPQLPDLVGVKVLAVDDSDDARELLSALLSQYGAEQNVVASGQELLAQLQTFKPDVLICDLSMPDMDGYTLLQQVRALPPEQGGTVAAIAVTAYAREEDRQQALDGGFQAHLAKPIEPEKLARAIATLTRQ